MECIGVLDELRAQLALTRLLIVKEQNPSHRDLIDFLTWILNACFAIGAECSDPLCRKPPLHKVRISAKHIERLEAEQTRIEARIALPREFVLSASTVAAAQMDITCTTARRFERNLVRLIEHVPGFDASDLLVFANRLSDCLYVMARWLDGGGGFCKVDYRLLE